MAEVKRKKPAIGRSGGKPRKPVETLDQYLAQVPAAVRSRFAELRAIVRSAVPAEAKEIISYRIPAFERDGVLVWFAAFSNHCSLFPTASVIETFRDELKHFSTSKGTVHFRLDKPLPTALIKKLVKARVKEKQLKDRSQPSE